MAELLSDIQKLFNLLDGSKEPWKANDNLVQALTKAHPNDQEALYFSERLQKMLTPQVERACQDLLEALFIDTDNDHNTKETARRMAKMFVYEVFAGRYTEPPTVTDFPNVKNVDQIHTVGPAIVRSACSHHMVPIMGQAWVGILPHKDEGRVLGLSKFVRLSDWVFARPQIQEEATEQLADIIETAAKPRGLAVVVRAEHLCMTWRGVKQTNTTMVTSAMRGAFKEDGVARAEFFNLIKGQGF